MQRWAIDIDRGDIRRAALVEERKWPLVAGEAEFRLDLAALTANNVTYAALGAPNGFLGEDAGYWDFFADRGAPGRLPVWGFATVARSNVAGLEEGEAFYGYWPLASHLVVQPVQPSATGFVDGTPRRQRLAPTYNAYQRVSAFGDHREADHALWPVWRPLYTTGWLIADQLADEADHGAEQVIVTAASSKTALAFAHAMRDRASGPRVIGLTSARSEGFVSGTGLYDAVLRYDAVEELFTRPSAIVDMAGDADVVASLRGHLGEALRFDLIVGMTHWDATQGDPGAGVPRAGFFAPGRLQKRGADWGGDELRRRLAAAWTGFMPTAHALTAVDERRGAEAALAAWDEVVNGRADPARAVLIAP